MAIKNSVKIYIDGINRTYNLVYPLKYGNFLDERLDEYVISLRGIEVEIFKPLTPVEIHVKNTLYWGIRNKVIERETEKVYRFIVANDSVTETQIKKGLYNHDLYLIEVTKAAECYAVDTLTFTNDLGRNYGAQPVIGDLKYQQLYGAIKSETNPDVKTYKTTALPERFQILSFYDTHRTTWITTLLQPDHGYSVEYTVFIYKLSDYKGRTSYQDESLLEPAGTAVKQLIIPEGKFETPQFVDIELGERYLIEYVMLERKVTIPPTGIPIREIRGAYCDTFTFATVENKLPLKKWTITDVINRTLDLAEPLRKGEKPRFRLNAEQAEKFDKMLAPQFSFTKQTLRECLQEVGKFVHGEPRLMPAKGTKEVDKKVVVKDETFTDGKAFVGANNYDPYENNVNYFVIINGQQYDLRLDSEASGGDDDYYLEIIGLSAYNGTTTVYTGTNEIIEVPVWLYEVSYDLFAGKEGSGMNALPYIKKSVSQVIDSYATYLDSNAENLVNELDKFSGVIVEPYKDGVKSVRTENLYVRIEDANMLIPTQYPIYSVEKLEYVYEEDGQLKSVDITPWLFEKSVYDTQLSSYTELYPYSKAYGLYYSQGSKNIGGLNFKVDAAVFAAFKEYAITNILRSATDSSSGFDSDYPKMCFRVTYTPFYSARVGQTKVDYKDFSRPAALIYNQASNVIESRYYGENLKGAIARIGNVEKSLTYFMYDINQVPKAGQLYDKDYYISVVAVEVLPTVFKCTIGLSKDFNRLSTYIGINSQKRYSEISQNQAVERNTLYKEYVVIGNQETPDKDTLTGNGMLELIAALFAPPKDNSGNNIPLGPVTNVAAWGSSYQDEVINTAVSLPVISSAFGNSLSFSWQYKDNYSAGDISEYVENALVSGNNKVAGYFQNSQPYTDYYGRLYYYNFDLQLAGEAPTPDNFEQIGQALPKGEVTNRSSGIVSTVGKTPYIMRKDNREALQINFQLDFVTNLKNMIIGSALASYCPAVRGVAADAWAPRLYVFDTELNKFTDHIEAYKDIKLSDIANSAVSVEVENGYLVIKADYFPNDGKSWAIVTPQRAVTTTVEGEDGVQTEQTTYYGGDLLIGQNTEVKAGSNFKPVYFTLKRDIFDKSVWKDIL